MITANFWRMLKGPPLIPRTYISLYYNATYIKNEVCGNGGVQKKFDRFKTEVCAEIYQLTSKACIVNPRRDPVFCIGNCNIVFLLLNDQYTILRRDSNPPKQCEDCYQSTPLPSSHHRWVEKKNAL